MSIHNLLRRLQESAVPPVPCSPAPKGTGKTLENQQGSPGSLSSPANHKGRVQQEVEHAANDPKPPAPEADIDLLLENLRFEFTGAPLHDIDNELAGAIRLAMLPMGRRARADLAALIDDELATEGRERVLALLQQRIETQPPATWLEWIKQACPLVDGDVEFIGKVLARLAPREQEQAAHRYVAAWQAAAEAEAQPHRQANAGRQAANQTLLPANSRPMATGSTRQPSTITEAPSLPAGVRMAWTIRVGDKRLVMTGTPYTREQAQQAAQARWPDADVEVVE